MTHAIPETQSQFEKPVVETDVEISSRQNSSEIQDPDRPLPTDEERKELRHVAGSIPWIAFALCFVEFAERASYYGATQVFNNFLQQPLPTGIRLHTTFNQGCFTKLFPGGNGAGAPAKHSEQPAGALGKGIQFASAFVLLFKFLAYTVPIFGGWLADTRIGRYPAIMIGVLICGVAHIIQIFGALPSVLQKGQGTSPFVISLFLLAIGAGRFSHTIIVFSLTRK
jgi:dipeptide/tripeptide permease